MFDIGFTEIMLIGIITLLVMGPQRLPETVRTIALWIGRIKHKLADARRELENEIGVDEIRRQVYNERIMQNLEKSKNQLQESVKATSEALRETAKDIEKQDIEQKDTEQKPADKPTTPKPSEDPPVG